MYQNINGVAQINGANGIYDGKIKNNSVRYARNAVDNYLKAYTPDLKLNRKPAPDISGLGTIDKDTYEKKKKEILEYINDTEDITPINFNLRYANNEAGKPDKMAVMGVAFEEMGKRSSMSVKELTDTLKNAVSDKNKDLVSAESLDINKDGKIDLSEYGTSILVEDMLSTDASELKAKNITGVITDEGQMNLLSFASKKNYQAAIETYKSVHDAFDLDTAEKEFLSDKNNLYIDA